jgi:hypothetical protein
MAMSMKHEWLGERNIDRRDASELDLATFRREYERKGKPVVITGLVNKWPAWIKQLWTKEVRTERRTSKEKRATPWFREREQVVCVCERELCVRVWLVCGVLAGSYDINALSSAECTTCLCCLLFCSV